MQNNISSILDLSKNRIAYFHEKEITNGFYQGSQTYFNGILDEMKEVEQEIKDDNYIHLEDELGDVFWDYICLLNSLEIEGRIHMDRVFERCYGKMSERIGTDARGGENWNEIKILQKARLKAEHKNIFPNSL